MLINEGGLIRAIKRAYKAGGYTVLNTGNDVAIYTDHWFAMANRALLPRKVLATIVEHMGMIPERDMPTSIIKDTEPQLVLRETAADDMDHWRGGDRGEEVTMVPVIMQGFQIYQPPGGGACWGVPLYLVDMIERDPAEHIGADVIDKDRLLWEADGEAVVINAVRKACSGWAKEWERAVWNALEGVDLHKEEAGRCITLKGSRPPRRPWGTSWAPSLSCPARGTTISTGYFVTAATRRTATLKTAPTKLNGIALPGG